MGARRTYTTKCEGEGDGSRRQNQSLRSSRLTAPVLSTHGDLGNRTKNTVSLLRCYQALLPTQKVLAYFFNLICSNYIYLLKIKKSKFFLFNIYNTFIVSHINFDRYIIYLSVRLHRLMNDGGNSCTNKKQTTTS